MLSNKWRLYSPLLKINDRFTFIIFPTNTIELLVKLHIASHNVKIKEENKISSLDNRINWLEREITCTQKSLEAITEEGTIYPTQKDGNVKWYVWKNGRREYLSKKNDKEIRNLVNKKYLELHLKDTINELRLLETNRKAQEKYRTDYAQNMLQQRHYSNILLADDKKENENRQAPNPENLKFYTKMGILVRSKSEVIIATALYDNNLKFEYERPVKIENNIYYPDFTVEKKKGDIIIWEHLGLIDNPDYRNKAYRKILKYNENGYYQGKNLILTYETAESPLDPMDVEHEIRKMCR